MSKTISLKLLNVSVMEMLESFFHMSANTCLTLQYGSSREYGLYTSTKWGIREKVSTLNIGRSIKIHVNLLKTIKAECLWQPPHLLMECQLRNFFGRDLIKSYLVKNPLMMTLRVISFLCFAFTIHSLGDKFDTRSQRQVLYISKISMWTKMV